MVTEIVFNVKSDNRPHPNTLQKQIEKANPENNSKSPHPQPLSRGRGVGGEVICPLCGKGIVLKGNTAFGCSEWKNGCTYRKAF